MKYSELLDPGDRCVVSCKGLHGGSSKQGLIQDRLPKRYMVVLDGETEAQPFGLKKVKRLGKPAKLKMGPVTGEPPPESDAYLEGILDRGDAQRAARNQRPPTRLHIPDANVPTYPVNNPTEIRDGEPDTTTFRGVLLSADPPVTLALPRSMRPQPKPRKPSRSAAYLQHVREHDCCNCGTPGPSDPDHVGPRGVGQKCSDHLTIPLCRPCHRFRTDFNVLPDVSVEVSGSGKRAVTRKFKHTPKETELIVLRAQVQMLREWAEKIEKENP